jgi:hypothetical protein
MSDSTGITELASPFVVTIWPAGAGLLLGARSRPTRSRAGQSLAAPLRTERPGRWMRRRRHHSRPQIRDGSGRVTAPDDRRRRDGRRLATRSRAPTRRFDIATAAAWSVRESYEPLRRAGATRGRCCRGGETVGAGKMHDEPVR